MGGKLEQSEMAGGGGMGHSDLSLAFYMSHFGGQPCLQIIIPPFKLVLFEPVRFNYPH